MTERPGAVTIHGNPLTVMGETVAVGQKAPNFALHADDMSTRSLANYAGQIKLISVVPSLDTGICDAQTRRFNEEAASLGEDVSIITVSAEHPFNQKRWCGAAGIDKIDVLSDHYDMNFGDAYGAHVKEWRLEQRSIFVLDKEDVIRYIEYVPEIAQHPNYEAALSAVKALK